MRLQKINEPGPVLQHPTGHEEDNPVAPNVHEEQCHTQETRQAQAERLAGALYVLEGLPPAEASALADYLLATLSAGFPQLRLLEDIRQTAALWGDCASHLELEAYVVVGLHRLRRVPLALCQRKRLLIALWGTLADDDRRAFLARVDQEGRIRGRGA